MRIPELPLPFHRRGSDEGAALAAMAACGLVGVLAATAIAMQELVALLRPLLPYMN